jgi:hypothetical protein
MSFSKILLLAAAVTTNLWASEERVTYSCTITEEIGDITPFSVQFRRDQNWRASWDVNGDWNKQERPAFNAEATISLPLEAEQIGKVHGRWLGGYTRLSGCIDVSVKASESSFSLSLVEDPSNDMAFGHGEYEGLYFFVSCSVTTEITPPVDG